MVEADWVQQEREHEYKMASLREDVNRRKRDHLTQRVLAVCWTVGIVAVVAIVASMIFFWQQDAGERGQKAELACLTDGGTWTGLNGGSDICVARVVSR